MLLKTQKRALPSPVSGVEMAASMLFRSTSREIATKFSSSRRRIGRSKRVSHLILAASRPVAHLDPMKAPEVVIVGGKHALLIS